MRNNKKIMDRRRDKAIGWKVERKAQMHALARFEVKMNKKGGQINA